MRQEKIIYSLGSSEVKRVVGGRKRGEPERNREREGVVGNLKHRSQGKKGGKGREGRERLVGP